MGEFPEDAVNEVKRQAVSELQKAVAAAEAKASELIQKERDGMDRTLMGARRSAQEEVLKHLNHQEESGEVRTINQVKVNFFVLSLYVKK